MNKRLDVLVSEYLGCPREYAKELVLAGKCTVNGKIINKPGAKFNDADVLNVDADKPKYVSRGGVKLEFALAEFDIDLQGALCVDIGASTGGFTDCVLQHGAKHVVAIENGTAQLHESLANHLCIQSLENTDIRQVDVQNMPYLADFICADLSFISLNLVIPKMAELLSPDGKMILLIKPQFEVGKGGVDKRGVARCLKSHAKAIEQIEATLSEHGLKKQGLVQSPIVGHAGNIEYLMHVVRI